MNPLSRVLQESAGFAQRSRVPVTRTLQMPQETQPFVTVEFVGGTEDITWTAYLTVFTTSGCAPSTRD